MSIANVNVRIPEPSREILKAIAAEQGLSMQEMLVQMIAEAENKQFFDKMRSAYERIQQDPEAKREESAMLDALDHWVQDGLEESPHATAETRGSLVN